MAFMRVKDLAAMLADLDPEALVVLAADVEGNGYNPVDNEGAYSTGRYSPAESPDGNFFPDLETGDVVDEEDRPPADAVAALCLWPVG
jgi:hypothetical protein